MLRGIGNIISCISVAELIESSTSEMWGHFATHETRWISELRRVRLYSRETSYPIQTSGNMNHRRNATGYIADSNGNLMFVGYPERGSSPIGRASKGARARAATKMQIKRKLPSALWAVWNYRLVINGRHITRRIKHVSAWRADVEARRSRIVISLSLQISQTTAGQNGTGQAKLSWLLHPRWKWSILSHRPTLGYVLYAERRRDETSCDRKASDVSRVTFEVELNKKYSKKSCTARTAAGTYSRALFPGELLTSSLCDGVTNLWISLLKEVSRGLLK